MKSFRFTYKRRFAKVLKSENRVLQSEIYSLYDHSRECLRRIEELECENERLKETQKFMERCFPLLKILLPLFNYWFRIRIIFKKIMYILTIR